MDVSSATSSPHPFCHQHCANRLSGYPGPMRPPPHPPSSPPPPPYPKSPPPPPPPPPHRPPPPPPAWSYRAGILRGARRTVRSSRPPALLPRQCHAAPPSRIRHAAASVCGRLTPPLPHGMTRQVVIKKLAVPPPLPPHLRQHLSLSNCSSRSFSDWRGATKPRLLKAARRTDRLRSGGAARQDMHFSNQAMAYEGSR